MSNEAERVLITPIFRGFCRQNEPRFCRQYKTCAQEKANIFESTFSHAASTPMRSAKKTTLECVHTFKILCRACPSNAVKTPTRQSFGSIYPNPFTARVFMALRVQMHAYVHTNCFGSVMANWEDFLVCLVQKMCLLFLQKSFRVIWSISVEILNLPPPSQILRNCY